MACITALGPPGTSGLTHSLFKIFKLALNACDVISPDVSTLRTTSKNGSRYRSAVISSPAVAIEASEFVRSFAASNRPARPFSSCAPLAGALAPRSATKASNSAS